MDSEVEVRDTILYRITPGEPVILWVESGYQQPSGTSLQLGTDIWIPDPKELENQGEKIAEDGEAVQYAVLYCITVVQDRRPDHNETSVIYRIGNGTDAPKVYPYALTANEDYGQVPYLINIHFV